MTSQHPSRTYKGCALCKPWKRKGSGERKYPWSVQRKIGKKRRFSQQDMD